MNCAQCRGELSGDVLVIEFRLDHFLHLTRRPAQSVLVMPGVWQGRMVVFSLPETGGSRPRIKAVRLRYCPGCLAEEGGLNTVLMAERVEKIVCELTESLGVPA